MQIVVASLYFDDFGVIRGPDSAAPVAYTTGSLYGFSHEKNQIDIFGHEYGHYIDNQVRRATQPPATNQPSFDYVESMMDVFGEASEGLVDISRGQGANNFSLNACAVYECGVPGDPYRRCNTPRSSPLAFDWPTDLGSCSNSSGANGQRKAFGNTYYQTWSWLLARVGATGVARDYPYYFRAWMSNILRSHFLVKRDAPSLLDFYAATVARLDGTALVLNFQLVLAQNLGATFSRPDGPRCFR
jgi:hypothetical protein